MMLTIGAAACTSANDPGSSAGAGASPDVAQVSELDVSRSVLGQYGAAYISTGSAAPNGSTSAAVDVPFPASAAGTGSTELDVVVESSSSSGGVCDVRSISQWGSPQDIRSLDLAARELPHYTSAPQIDVPSQRVQ